MKRAKFDRAAMAGLILLAGAGCSPPATPESETPRARTSVEGWTRPPTIETVRRAPTGLIFVGQSEPGARVVLRSDSGPAHAASADSQGRFEIRMEAPAVDLLLRPETQVGQEAAPSPERLLIVAGPQGPVAMLTAGGGTRRLDAAPALGAVDSDGRLRLLSGSGSPGGPPIEVQAGNETGRVTPDASGRWSLVLTPSSGPEEIRVAGQAFIWPGDRTDDTAFQVERSGAGWRVVWRGPAGGRQTTWLPDGD